jgi:hypothetical protein
MPRLSLVVLPFENLGGDPKDEYLAEGITDDLTSDFSSAVWLRALRRWRLRGRGGFLGRTWSMTAVTYFTSLPA